MVGVQPLCLRETQRDRLDLKLVGEVILHRLPSDLVVGVGRDGAVIDELLNGVFRDPHRPTNPYHVHSPSVTISKLFFH